MTAPRQALACSLTDQALRDRRALARQRLQPAVMSADRAASVLTVTFAASPGLRTEVEAFLALEQQCCGFLDFALEEDPDRDHLRLAVRGPEGAEHVLRLMEAVLTGTDRPPA